MPERREAAAGVVRAWPAHEKPALEAVDKARLVV
jgi:hypothetical protein